MRVVWKKAGGLICLIFVLLSMALPVAAEESHEDSNTIPEEVLACLDEENIDTIFCVYVFGSKSVRCSYKGFPRYGDIERVLANVGEPELQRYYYVKDEAGETAIYTYDSEGLSEEYRNFGWFSFHGEQAASIIQTIDAGIVVENIYYLQYPDWYAVYYKTNLGDYVYALDRYLMALEPFLALQEELYVISSKYWDYRDWTNEAYQVELSEVHADLSPYVINSPDFDPHAPLRVNQNFYPGKMITISTLALLVVLIVGRFLIRGHRKYRATKDKMAYRI